MTSRESGAGRRRIATALVLLLCLVAGGLESVRRGTDANWDLRNYHLYAAHALVEGRLHADVAPAQLQSYLNPLAQLPHYVLVRTMNDRPRLLAFLQGFPAGIYAFLLLVICVGLARRLLGDGAIALVAGVLAAAVGWSGAGFRSLIGMSSNDIGIGALILGALALALRGTGGGQGWRGALAAGALVGAAAGLKMTAALYALPLGVMILATGGLRAAVPAVLGMLGGFLALAAPHAVSLWAETGNPLFPFYNDVFRSPDWFAARLADERFRPADAWQAFLYPFLWARPSVGLVGEVVQQDIRVAALLVTLGVAAILGPFLAVSRRRRATVAGAPATAEGRAVPWRPVVLLLGTLVLATLLWLRMFGVYRYLLVVESLAGLAILVLLAAVLRVPSRPAAAILGALLLAGNVWIIVPDWGVAPHRTLALDIPSLPVPPDALVLTADDAPHAYLALALPRTVRMLGINTNFVKPGPPIGLNARIERILAEHRGPVVVIRQPGEPPPPVVAALAHHRLEPGACTTIRTNVEPGGHAFCEARRRD